MTVMQVNPSGKSDPKLVALAAQARDSIEELLAYVDTVPPKLTYAKLRDLRYINVLLRLEG